MKTLYLIRHAKSDRSIAELSDIDRPLNARGYTDAHKMSLIFKNKNIIPDIIISSPAIRALSTALIFCRNLNLDPKTIEINQQLYDTSIKEYLRCITQTDNKFKTVFLFGHNPTITNMANELTNACSEEIPTCGIVGIISDEKEWKHFERKNNSITYVDFPKKHA
jgi:phosphohistidine phosphatase